MPTPSPTPAADFPLELADRCVKCGLCLPHCPTYGLAGLEGESPRGRIALMQGLATGRLQPDAILVDHLDNCLGCRACERACPAAVPYGELIDAGRALLVEQGIRPGAPRRGLAALLRRPRLLHAVTRLARIPGAAWLAAIWGGLPARAMSLLPADARAPRRRAAPADAPRGRVQLFTGCVGYALDGQGLDDTRHVLEAAGWAVDVPRSQGCCGAIDLHAGRPGLSARAAQRNLQAFAGEGPIVACASGCGATLKEYARLAGAPGAQFASRVTEPAELFADAELPLGQARYRDVVLHIPCTQRNVTGAADATRRLLSRLPGLRLRELPAGCCGAAGETFLSRPELADALLAPLLEDLGRAPPDALVTSNIGCALHFRAGLQRAGLDVPVLSPASLCRAALESRP